MKNLYKYNLSNKFPGKSHGSQPPIRLLRVLIPLQNVLFFQHGLTYESSILQDNRYADMQICSAEFLFQIPNFVFWQH